MSAQFNQQLATIVGQQDKNTEDIKNIKFHEKVTPQMFGAKANAKTFSDGYWRDSNGNVANDDTKAIQAAIAYAKATNAQIYFPAGKYRITGQFVIDFNGCTINGESEYNTVICPDSGFVGTSVLIVNPAYSNNALQNFTIKNFTFDFMAVSVRGIEFGYLIYGCEFKNLYFTHATKACIMSMHGKDASEQIIFDNLQFHTFGLKLSEPLTSFTQLHESVFKTCRFFGTIQQEVVQEYPLCLLDTPQGITFIGCDFFYQTGVSCIKCISSINGTIQGVFVYGCTFENNQGDYIMQVLGGTSTNEYATFINFNANRRNSGTYKIKLEKCFKLLC